MAAAARVLRNRDQTRSLPVTSQPSQGIYDVLVAEARHLLAVNSSTRPRPRPARRMKMNVVPSLTADRAEAVLNDIAIARSHANVASNPAAQGGAESPSVVAERQANELLAKGQSVEAASKLVQADRLKAQEMAVAADRGDAAVSRVATPTTPPTARPRRSGPDPRWTRARRRRRPDGSGPRRAAAPGAGRPVALADAPADGNKGVELLSQAKALFASGNYPAAREKATEAKTGGYGVDAQADEMLAQIALSEQGGALAVYEAALDASARTTSARLARCSTRSPPRGPLSTRG